MEKEIREMREFSFRNINDYVEVFKIPTGLIYMFYDVGKYVDTGRIHTKKLVSTEFIPN